MSELNQSRVIGTWQEVKGEGRSGTGNWDAWDKGVEEIIIAAKAWERSLQGVEKPWLCWNVDNDWCKLQQKLVLAVGWTPVVGSDTFVDNVEFVEGAIPVNFNQYLKLPRMWMHFPLEFVFLFCDKLAFWHSDFLCTLADMEKFAQKFEKLYDGQCAAAMARESRWPWRDKSKDRYFELLGCTTRGASREQFVHGTGWWRNINKHPNFIPSHHVKEYNYEHGVGVLVWEEIYHGHVIKLFPDEKKGHYNMYIRKLKTKNSKSEEMKYYDLKKIAKKLGLSSML